MSQEQETGAALEEGTRAKSFSAVGGVVGTAVGARRGPLGALAGGLIGGTLGYLAGSTLAGPRQSRHLDADPVSIDVAAPDDTEGSRGEGAAES